MRSKRVPDTLRKKYLRCWIHRPAKNDCAFYYIEKEVIKITVSKAQKAATAKYEKENYDKILVRFPKGTKEKIKAKSDSVNGFIVDAVNKELEKVD